MDVRIILLNTQEDGNIGSAARAMRNFGFSELYLVNPCEIGKNARAMSSHGANVLESAKTVKSLEAALRGCDYVIGTTGKSGGQKTPRRRAVAPDQLSKMVAEKGGKVALVFGNEAVGIPNEVLQKMDFVVRIPANPDYPILNLAQSVCILLYEISKGRFSKADTEKPMPRAVRTQLDRFTLEIISKVYEQPHQQWSSKETLFTIYGKAMLTKAEGGKIISFYRKILAKLGEEEGQSK